MKAKLNAHLIATRIKRCQLLAPEMVALLERLTDMTKGCCNSCGCKPASEGYCGCAPPEDGCYELESKEYNDRCAGRALLARINADPVTEGCEDEGE